MNATLDIKLFGVTGSTTTAIVGSPDGGFDIRGAPAVAPARTDDSYVAQTRAETLAGTTGSDLIYADDPAKAPPGTSERLLDIDVSMPQVGWEAVTARVTGLPDGYAIALFVDGLVAWLLAGVACALIISPRKD